jgi:hypothetical protein
VKPTVKMVRIDRIKDNPYRDKKRNPINQEKVEQLAESIEATDFWNGVYGRELKDGTVELAFGHHRLEAARVAGRTEVPLTIENMSDGEMLMRMARENVTGTVPIMLEAISAAVQAFGEGKIDIPAPDAKTRKDLIRYAPSFIPGGSSTAAVDHPYTIDTLARFLGYVKRKSNTAKDSVVSAIGALELMEKKVINDQDIARVNNKDLAPMVSDLRKRHEEITIRNVKNAEEQAKLREQQLKLEEQRKTEIADADRKYKEELKRKAQAEREENERKARKSVEEIKRIEEQRKAREENYKKSREKLDATIKATAERHAEERKAADGDLATRHQMKTVLTKLNLITSESFGFREELKSAARNEKAKSGERELIRRALLAAGEWYRDQSKYFLPPEEAAKLTADTVAQIQESRLKAKNKKETK